MKKNIYQLNAKKARYENKLILSNIDHEIFIRDFYCTHSFVRLTKDFKYDDMLDVISFNESATLQDTISFISDVLMNSQRGTINLIIFFSTNSKSIQDKIKEYAKKRHIVDDDVKNKIKIIKLEMENVMRKNTSNHPNFLSTSTKPLQ